MGSFEHSLSSLTVDGFLQADGGSFGEDARKMRLSYTGNVGPGGGSGGTILVFIRALSLSNNSIISTLGGHGSPNGGGGGGGGRIHFHWYKIPVGDEYSPLASVNGSIMAGLV